MNLGHWELCETTTWATSLSLVFGVVDYFIDCPLGRDGWE